MNKNKENERYIVTSALPYVNGIKHLGNLVGSLLPADVYARYLRRKGKDVIYICGTDEHGTPAELAARKEGMPVEEYCKKYHEIQKRIYEGFHLDFTYFGRTSSKENHEITQSIFLKLWEKGDILIKETQQLYCLIDKMYLPDTYVTGTCPHCGYERARGDQCEHCATLLDPTELIEPHCLVCGKSEIEVRKTKHLYLDLPKIEPKIRSWVETKDSWPTVTKSIALKWLNEGLKPRAITRNLRWGIPIPLNDEEFKDLRFYVWFDAPNGYISITKEWANHINQPALWEEYWKDPSTKLIQFMGSDNIPFHTVIWPASIIEADEGYVLAHMIKGFKWLTYEGGKFSTSQNRGVFTDQALELYPADYWRYYLLLIAPERQNTDFKWTGFQEAVNKDLLGALGNLVNRVVTFLNKEFNGIITDIDFTDPDVKALRDLLENALHDYEREFDAYEFQKAIVILRDLWHAGNKFFQSRAPWAKIKEGDKAHAHNTLSFAAHYIRAIAILSEPIIPKTAETIFKNLGLPPHSVHETHLKDVLNFQALADKKISSTPEILFTKIQNKEIQELIKRFGGPEKQKKTKKQKKKQKTKETTETTTKKPKVITYDHFAALDIRIGEIIDAEPIKGSNKLLKLRVNLGNEIRTIVSGIGDQYAPSDLIHKKTPVLVNLKPRKLKGVMSEGMILMTGSDDLGWYFLTPEKDVPSGTEIC